MSQTTLFQSRLGYGDVSMDIDVAGGEHDHAYNSIKGYRQAECCMRAALGHRVCVHVASGQNSPSTSWKRRVDWSNASALDENRGTHDSRNMKRARINEPQSLSVVVPSAKSIDQWRLGC
ncbi:hypothetical protein BDV93DRAFT_526835 [Ceratobasidium sp. AG-I]|nr:hypothetical protein BDV93DRAFT_526835 [Ceratobasidium sp. AG-I]